MESFLEEFKKYKAPIKYRGKTKDGEWVCGYYDASDCSITCVNDAGKVSVRLVHVDTVSPYTGFKTLDGKKEVYQGDILFAKGVVSFVVGFKDGCFVGLSTNKIQRLNWEPANLKNLVTDEYMRYEVVGNIYNNPELIEL